MIKKSKVVLMLACVMTVVLVLCCLLFACDGKDSGVPKEYLTDPALEIYSQRAHIGYQQSLDNVKKYEEYSAMGEPAFVIPGLNQGENFVLQGIAYQKEQNLVLLGGYIKPATENINSVIFVIDMSKYIKVDEGVFLRGALTKEILLDKEDGTPFTGHAGGLAASKNTVWLSTGSKLYYIPLTDILAAPASSHIKLDKSIKVPVNASYTEYSEGVLWVGEFELASANYVTNAAHHDANDKKLTAWTVGYKLDETGKAGYDPATGIKSESLKDVAVPDIVLWHRELVQGMTAIGESNGNLKVLLSTSYGHLAVSNLYTYEVPWNSPAPGTVEVGGVQVPCYKLTECESMTAPPMLEDLAHVEEDGQHYVFVACESGSYNYHGGEAMKSKDPTDLIWKLKLA